MKNRVFHGVVIVGLLFASHPGCAQDTTVAKSQMLAEITVGPNNTVSWDDAQVIIRKGDVDYVGQNHARDVIISMKNGTRYHTVEPKIDAVNDVLKSCGKWGKVGYVTE